MTSSNFSSSSYRQRQPIARDYTVELSDIKKQQQSDDSSPSLFSLNARQLELAEKRQRRNIMSSNDAESSRQPFSSQTTRLNVENEKNDDTTTKPAPRSTAASTTVLQQKTDQRALLRQALLKKSRQQNRTEGVGQASSSKSAVQQATTTSTISNAANDSSSSSYLRSVLQSSAKTALQRHDDGSAYNMKPLSSSRTEISSAATSTLQYDDQRALLQSVLLQTSSSKKDPPEERKYNTTTTSKSLIDTRSKNLSSSTRRLFSSSQQQPRRDDTTSSSSSLRKNTVVVEQHSSSYKHMAEEEEEEKSSSKMVQETAAETTTTRPDPPTVTLGGTTTLMERLMKRQEEREHLLSGASSGNVVAATTSKDDRDVVAPPLSRPSLNVRSLSSSSSGAKSYEEFLQILQKEVSGDHTELWTSFRAVFTKNVPLSSSVSTNNNKHRRRVKFDSKTKRMLVEMNLHLKRNNATTTECVSETQLVSDKKMTQQEKQDIVEIRRQLVAERTKLYEKSNEKTVVDDVPKRSSNTSKWTPKVKVAMQQSSDEQHQGTEGGSSSTASVIGSSMLAAVNSDATSDVAIEEQASRKAQESENDKETTNSQQTRSSDAPGTQSAPKQSEQHALFSPIQRAIDIPAPEKAASDYDDDDSDGLDETATTTAESNPYDPRKSWLTSYRERQADECALGAGDSASPTNVAESSASVSSMRHTSLLDAVPEEAREEVLTPRTLAGRKRGLVETSSDAGTSSDVPWSTLKLRPTPLVKATSHTPTAGSIKSGRQTSSTASAFKQNEGAPFVAPWSSIKLRSVQTPRADDPTPDQPSSDNGRIEVDNTASSQDGEQPQTKEDSLKSDIASSRPPLPPPTANKERSAPSPSECPLHAGDEVDLENLPSSAFDSQEDAAIIDLRGDPSQGGNMSVVIGKKVLFIAESLQEERSSRISWCVSRQAVKSLTLDMADNRADVSLSDGSLKALLFVSVEGVLLFAGVFYQTSIVHPAASSSVDDSSCVEEAGNAATHSERSGDSSSSSTAADDFAASGLTEEERKVLETYRQMRRTKDPEEAIREVIAAETDSSSLTEDEEKVAATYRKMLKFKIPAEAVRHKMKKDDVSEKIVLAVFPVGNSEGEPDTAASSDQLSAEEERIAEDYRKMLKLRIPSDAVRHKMTKDQVSSKIIEAVLGDGSTESMPEDSSVDSETKSKKSALPNLTEEEESVALTYRKMLKMMIPPDAVRHKMQRDQVGSKIVLAVLGPDPNVTTPPSTDSLAIILSPEEEKVAESYRKMLKMMIPAEAVRHKMKKDQVDSKIALVVLGPDPTESKKEPPTKPLTLKEQAAVEEYRKMLRMQIPIDAVRHKMVKDGAPEAVIRAVIGGDAAGSRPTLSKASSARGNQLVNIHWTVLSGEELDNSIWRASKKQRVSAPQPEGSDISKLVELFQKKTNTRVGTVAESSNTSGDEMAKLLDLTRANNVAISLKAFKEFTHKELADTIANLDPLRKIRGERVQFVKDLLPTPVEAKAIKAYKGSGSRLVPAELFFKQIITVPRIQAKVQVMQMMDTFKDNVSDLRDNLKILAQVCHQIMTSIKLQEVLEMVLHVGNIMNEGTRTGGASGFKFDSLLKLTQTKSSDGRTTVLDYIVMIFVAKEKEDTLDLFLDFPECQAASRMAILDMVGEVSTMKGTLTKCRTELVHMRKDAGVSTADAAATDPRAALMAAIAKRGIEDEDAAPKKKEFSHRAAFLAAIETKAQKPEAVDSESADATSSGTGDEDDEEDEDAFEDVKSDAETPDREDSIRGGIERLEQLIEDAEDVLAKLEKDRDIAVDACKALSRYCGESGGERAAAPVLGILAQFASNLADAVKKYHARAEAEARREAAQKKKEEQQALRRNKGNDSHRTTPVKVAGDEGDMQDSTPLRSDAVAPLPPRSTPRSPRDSQSLVFMVNQLLKEVPENIKEDYKSGVVYENPPDEKLRAIYKKERQSLGFSSPVTGRPTQMDLLSAIKKRQERAETTAIAKAEHETSLQDTVDSGAEEEEGPLREYLVLNKDEVVDQV